MKILVGYDGSDNSKRALGRAIELSNGMNAELIIVLHVDVQAFETFAAKRLLAEWRNKMIDDAERLVADAALAAGRDGVKNVRTVVLEGADPSDAILSVAEANIADLIVVGRRGLGSVERFLIGSVSSRLVDHAKCDVLVVK